MKAPLSNRVKNLLKEKKDSTNLMKSIIYGERNGGRAIVISGKNYQLKKLSEINY